MARCVRVTQNTFPIQLFSQYIFLASNTLYIKNKNCCADLCKEDNKSHCTPSICSRRICSKVECLAFRKLQVTTKMVRAVNEGLAPVVTNQSGVITESLT